MLSNLLFIITGLIGLITTFLIFTNYKSNRIMNLYIILFILIISLRFFLSGLTNFIFDSNFRTTYFKYSNFSLVVIPICYLYFKNLSENYRKLNSKELLHFIFPVALFLAMAMSKFCSKAVLIIWSKLSSSCALTMLLVAIVSRNSILVFQFIFFCF